MSKKLVSLLKNSAGSRLVTGSRSESIELLDQRVGVAHVVTCQSEANFFTQNSRVFLVAFRCHLIRGHMCGTVLHDCKQIGCAL